MLAMHCGSCWETPCVCPRYPRIPTAKELGLLSVAELQQLEKLVQSQLQFKTQTVVATNTTGVGRLTNSNGTQAHWPVVVPED